MVEQELSQDYKSLYSDACAIIEEARQRAYRAVNTYLTLRNWQLGERIAREELDGAERAEYGKHIIERLAQDLTNAYGKGFDRKALYNYLKFYRLYPEIVAAVSRQFEKLDAASTKSQKVLLATYKILKDSINVDINEDEITQSIVEGIKRQNLACKTTDELASFWDKLIYLFIQEQTLYVNGHFRVERRKRVKSLSKEERAWDTPHPVLYLRKDGIMEMYQEACKKVGEKFIPKESLEFYLKSAPYFIFESKCRFKAFTKTGIEIPDYSKPVGVGAFKQQEHSLTAYCFDYAWLQEMYDIDLERVPCKDEETDIEPPGLFDK